MPKNLKICSNTWKYLEFFVLYATKVKQHTHKVWPSVVIKMKKLKINAYISALCLLYKVDASERYDINNNNISYPGHFNLFSGIIVRGRTCRKANIFYMQTDWVRCMTTDYGRTFSKPTIKLWLRESCPNNNGKEDNWLFAGDLQFPCAFLYVGRK